MQPVDLSTIAQNLGPGVGGIWLGEQQQNAMNESNITQRRGLEDIATAQQNRDIAGQKLPLELQKLRDENALNPGRLQKQKLENEESATKLSKAKYQDFVEGLTQMDPAIIPPMQRAAYLNELSQRTGIPADHPMYEAALRAQAAGGDTWKKFQETFRASPAEQAKEASAQARTETTANAGVRGHEISAGATVEAARIAAQSREQVAALKGQAQQKLASIDQRLVQLTAIINNPQTDPQAKAVATAEAQQLVQAKQAVQTAIVTERADQLAQVLQMPSPGAGQFANPYGGQQPQQPPQAPPPGAQQPPMVPPGQPPQQPAPQVAPQQAPPPQQAPQAAKPPPAVGARGKTKDGKDVMFDGKGWVLIQG